MKSKSSSAVILVAVLILFVMSACLGGPTTPTPPVTPCPTPFSIYNMRDQIPTGYVTDWSQLSPLQALGFLTRHVERWSDYEDLVLDEYSTYRITVTLVSPNVRRAAYVMESIHRHRTHKEITEGLDQISNSDLDKKELRFLVTVTLKYTGADIMAAQDKVTIPPEQLVMFDRKGEAVPPASVESALLTSFDAVDGPFAAYVTYPLQYEDCTPTIDLASDTSVTLKLKGINIGTKPFNDVSWTISLLPLVSIGIPTMSPNPTASATTAAPYYLEPWPVPPTPNPGDMNAFSLDNYWIDFTKFIWAKLSASNSR